MLEPVSISAFALSTPITQKNITPAINAPSGAIYIDEKSSNVPKIFPSSTNKPIANATIHTPITAIFLSICKLFCIASIGTSNKHTSVVIDAQINDIKNNIANTQPKGINLNTDGNVINNSGGPDAGSRPNANTEGIITSAAVNAAIVSNNTVFLAPSIISISLPK